MEIGLIGAGKVGFSLGRYLVEHGINVLGYYSLHYKSAEEAAIFTGTKAYRALAALIRECDLVFITVPDDSIEEIWDMIKSLEIEGKIFCHCSGSLSSNILKGASDQGAFAYSVHPLCAINSKAESYKDLDKAYFTIEGSEEKMLIVEGLLKRTGNNYQKLEPNDRALYHAAAVTVSNQINALLQQGFLMLEKCGFSKDSAVEALWPLIICNIRAIHEMGTERSLTGPIERADYKTVCRHLEAMESEDKMLYALLSLKLIQLAEKKHPDREYERIKTKLKKVVENKDKPITKST